MKRIFFAFFYCVLVISGCSARPPSPEMDLAHGLQGVNSLIERYGALQDPELTSFNNYLSTRFETTYRTSGLLKDARDPLSHLQLILLNTPVPMAFSPGGGFIAASKGLILSLSNEAELAFVLAHEIAHQRLGHVLIEDEYSKANAAAQQQELEADSFAVGLMAQAGYDPRAASYAIVNAYSSSSTLRDDPHYPQLSARLNAIEQQINASNWTPPGTVNRREFKRFQLLLKKL